jgi:hypothetical protein
LFVVVNEQLPRGLIPTGRIPSVCDWLGRLVKSLFVLALKPLRSEKPRRLRTDQLAMASDQSSRGEPPFAALI